MSSISIKFMMVLVLSFSVLFNYAEDLPTFEENPKLKMIKDYSVLDLGKLNLKRPNKEPWAGNVTDYSGMAYDVHHHRVLMFGGGHAATWSDSVYAFSFKSMKWKELYEPTPFQFYKKSNLEKSFWRSGIKEGFYPRPVGRHTYDLLVIPENRKELLMLRTGTGPSVAAPGFGYENGAGGVFDFKSKKWQMIPGKDIPFGQYGAIAEYDPVSKKVIGVHGNHVYAFDPATKTSKLILENVFSAKVANGYSGCLVYYPPNKKMYLFTEGAKEVVVLDLNRNDFSQSTVRSLVGTGGKYPKEETSFVYDAKNKVIGGGIQKNIFYSFDPSNNNKWQTKKIIGGNPQALIFHCIVYSKIDNAYIFIGKDPADQYGLKTYAYRWKN